VTKCYGVLIAILVLAALPVAAAANARLVNVTAAGGGCVYGPSGPGVQAWDVEPGQTYTITISNVVECANGGTDPTLNVRVNSTSSGNTDLVAIFVATGVYTFDFTVPAGTSCTMPIFYCTAPGDDSSGLFVIRDDGLSFQAHLRASTFDVGCTNPQEIIGPDCGAVPVDQSTWGRVKALYR